jgi:hypothetical protein
MDKDHDEWEFHFNGEDDVLNTEYVCKLQLSTDVKDIL